MLAISSMSDDEPTQDIVKHTAGVVFLGTPHRGSSAAGIGEIARKAASMLMMDTNPRILDSLSLKNSDLERCQDTFSSLWRKHNFQVKTFQEGLPLKLPMWLGQSKMSKVICLAPKAIEWVPNHTCTIDCAGCILLPGRLQRASRDS